jgi:hypothetical protein
MSMKQFILFFLILSFSSFGQTISRQMILSQGSRDVLTNRMLFSQSIGQQSVIGNYKGAFNFSQGFQQSQWKDLISTNSPTLISTITFPNPFISSINFKFSEPILKPIEIHVFDVSGKLVYFNTQSALNNLVLIDLQNLVLGIYFVRLKSFNYIHYAQIIKQ